jgi:flagellar basal body-associated protein FliL
MSKEAVDQKDVEEGAHATSDETPSKKNKKLLLGGGLASIVAAGALAAVMAVPTKETTRNYSGPFSQTLFLEDFTVNIQEEGRTRFLKINPVAMYLAYEPKYLMTRMKDELYVPEVQNMVFQIASRKTLDEIYGEVNESTFMEELKDVLDPVLFPVHIGDSSLPWDLDSASGLRPGLSSDKTTMRGRFDEHVLHVDAPQTQLWIDDGPRATFVKGDLDARVITSEGDVVFLDTSGLKPGYVGQVKIGVQGQIMRIRPGMPLVQ